MERIPRGHQRVETFPRGDGQFGWRLVAANYQIISAAGEGFSSKGAAKRAATNATGVQFPDGQDHAYLARPSGRPQENPAFPNTFPEPVPVEPHEDG